MSNSITHEHAQECYVCFIKLEARKDFEHYETQYPNVVETVRFHIAEKVRAKLVAAEARQYFPDGSRSIHETGRINALREVLAIIKGDNHV
jgi:hypothetical protein